VVTRVYGEGEYQLSGAKKSVYLSDQLGSVRDVVDADSGALLGALDYRPYGQVYRQVGDKPLYQYGQLLWEPTVELNVSPTRLYNASVGRWMSRDPIREAGGINLYGYVEGSPISLIDPSGNCPMCLAIPAAASQAAPYVMIGVGAAGLIWNNAFPPATPVAPPLIFPHAKPPRDVPIPGNPSRPDDERCPGFGNANSDTPIEKQLRGKGQLKDLRSNRNVEDGVDMEELLGKTPRELQGMQKSGEITKKTLKQIQKAFEGRDLGKRGKNK
jgi:RHS repeat-associated protein